MPTPNCTTGVRLPDKEGSPRSASSQGKSTFANLPPYIQRRIAADAEDRSVHDWYRFVLSFPPHLVRKYLDRFDVRRSDTVLDPFCGTGTTPVECKKLGIGSVGIEPNPMAFFASSVKVDWSVSHEELLGYAEEVALSTKKTLEEQGFDEWKDLPLFAANGNPTTTLKELPAERSKILLKDSISPRPLHKALVLLDAIDREN